PVVAAPAVTCGPYRLRPRVAPLVPAGLPFVPHRHRRDDGGVPLSTRGRLLVASPDLVDPNFRRTVVLVLTHDAEGAVGLVLNRPTDIAIGEALPNWRDATAPPACLYVGGPVQPDAAIGLGLGGT